MCSMPWRVNLIGEHIDYNGGYVLPAALEFGTTLIIREREDNKLQLASTNMSYEGTLDTSTIGKEKQGNGRITRLASWLNCKAKA